MIFSTVVAVCNCPNGTGISRCRSSLNFPTEIRFPDYSVVSSRNEFATGPWTLEVRGIAGATDKGAGQIAPGPHAPRDLMPPNASRSGGPQSNQK